MKLLKYLHYFHFVLLEKALLAPHSTVYVRHFLMGEISTCGLSVTKAQTKTLKNVNVYR